MEGIQHRPDCADRRVSHGMRPDPVDPKFAILIARCLDCGRSLMVRRLVTELFMETAAKENNSNE